MKILFLTLVMLLTILIVSAETPYTVEVITARGYTKAPINFFNSDGAQTFTGVLERNSPAVRIETNSIYVGENEFGSFNLIIGEFELDRGVYFDRLKISNNKGIFQEIPIIVGLESKSSQIEYDVSFDFDSKTDVSVISGETILSPAVNIYKLNYNNPSQNSVALILYVYSVDGELLSKEEEVVSVSRQASFEHFFNLGENPLNEVLLVASVTQGQSVGLDLEQVSVSSGFLFSPPSGRDYSSTIYMAVFAFLLSSIVLISYLWYNHSLSQAKDWKSQIDDLRKMKFSDATKGLRRLQAQKNVLERAYGARYISKKSFDSAIFEINKMSDKLKKRL